MCVCRFSSWSRWGTVRNTAATIAANRAAEQAKKARQQQQKQQLKRPASADDMVAAPDDGNSKAGSEPVTKEQRLERPGRLQGATAAMIVGGQVRKQREVEGYCGMCMCSSH